MVVPFVLHSNQVHVRRCLGGYNFLTHLDLLQVDELVKRGLRCLRALHPYLVLSLLPVVSYVL